MAVKDNKNNLKSLFENYQPHIYKIDVKQSTEILDSAFDVLLSNNIAYPEMCLGFHHYMHRAKDKMELTENFANRKKVYLVTSEFEKTIDKKEITEDGEPYISIDMGLKKLIEEIKPDTPEILSRAFLKLWEMIVYFDLIPNSDNFVSAHLAEGPGSFIQATILFRDMLAKFNKIKTSKNDKYYAVTLHSDNEHLLIEKEFINYYDKEKPKRLHILNTVNKKNIKEQKGGKRIGDSTDGDITNLHTINLFGGKQNAGGGYSEEADLVTADGGFDWKKENLQEQEAYRLIFGQMLAALKTQKSGGNFVLKIFETYTKNTIKILELLRLFYNEVYICKPFTSRISNSEKYIVCKKFDKKLFNSSIAKKMEEMISVMNINKDFNVVELFSNFKLSDKILNFYKNINVELSLKQYVGINNIIQFIHLDNYNGNEYNKYLDKQIKASIFWVNTFLTYSNFGLIEKWVDEYKHTFTKVKPITQDVVEKQEQKELSRIFNVSNVPDISDINQSRSSIKKLKSNFKSKSKTNIKTKSKTNKKQKAGGIDSEIDNVDNNYDPTDKIAKDAIANVLVSDNSDLSSVDSNKEYMTKLKNVIDFNSDVEELTDDKREVIDIIDDNIDYLEKPKIKRNTFIKKNKNKNKK
jgi:23S rRNA U2552 (ribose-2'-O)-methylase RlmE/FtsJ